MLRVFWKKMKQFQKLPVKSSAYNPSRSVNHTSKCELCLHFRTNSLNSRSCLHYRMTKTSEFFVIFGIKSFEHFHLKFRDATKKNHFVKVIVSMFFHESVKYIFEVKYCTLSKCSLSFIHCRIIFHSFNITNVCELYSNFRSMSTQTSFGSINFCNHSQKCKNCFFGSFAFIFLHLRFHQTGLDEPVHTLHRQYLWLVYQCMPDPYTKFLFWIWQMLPFPCTWLEYTLYTDSLNAKNLSPMTLVDC